MSGTAITRHLVAALLLLPVPVAIVSAQTAETPPGVSLEAIYRGEIFSSLLGGASETAGANYLGLLDVVGILETQGLRLWTGGRLVVYAQDGHGRGITEDYVGDAQILSNISADDFTRISELWYEQRFWGQRFRVKLGKQDANTDFAASDFTGGFINSSFGLIPTVPIPTYPEGARGVAVFGRPFRDLQLGAGLYRVNGAPMMVGELQWRPAWFTGRNPGAYRIGYWRLDAELAQQAPEGKVVVFEGNYGVYLNLDQWIFHESGSGQGSEGLALAAQFGWTPGDRNPISRYLGGAALYTGLIPGREADVTGFGVARAGVFSSRSGEDRPAETAVELFYRLRATDWLALQPDVQYILNPSGVHRDALALGLRFELGFDVPLF